MEKTDLALSKILNVLADKFGTTVEHLYSIMIRQAYIDGFENIFIIVVISTITILFYRFLLRDYKNEQSESWTDYFDECNGVFIITLLLAMIFIVSFVGCIIGCINCFANPEYYALHKILKSS